MIPKGYYYRPSSFLKRNKSIISNPYTYVRKINEKKNAEDSSFITSLIRKLRIEKHLTIADLSKDICSISYLSKLENGLIETNHQTMALLFDRLGVDYNSFKIDNEKLDLHKTIYFYMNEDEKNLSSLFEIAKNNELNIDSSLIKVFYYLLKREFNNALDEITAIEPIKETLNHNESTIYLFLLAEYHHLISDYNSCYDYLKLLELIDISDTYLNLLIIELRIKTGLNLSNLVLLTESLNEFDNKNISIFPRKRRIEIDLISLYMKVYEYPNQVLNTLNEYEIHALTEEEKIIFYYYKTIIKTKLVDIKYLYDDLMKHRDYFKYGKIYSLFGYLVYLLEEERGYQELIEMSSEYDFDLMDTVDQKFVCFVLMIAAKIDDHDLLFYLKEDIITPKNTEYHFLYDDCYRSVYIKLLESFSKYKEAYVYLRDKDKKLAKIAMF